MHLSYVIKQLILDQGIVIEYFNHKVAEFDSDVVEEQQEISGAQALDSPGVKRKCLFPNTQRNQKNKRKIVDHYKSIQEEISNYIKDPDYDAFTITDI